MGEGGGGRRSVGVEKWRTFERNVEVWSDDLRRWRVDDKATKSLFLLAQLSNDGYDGANMIISKLLKKETDGEEIRNSSAFVHASVLRVRQKLQPYIAQSSTIDYYNDTCNDNYDIRRIDYRLTTPTSAAVRTDYRLIQQPHLQLRYTMTDRCAHLIAQRWPNCFPRDCRFCSHIASMSAIDSCNAPRQSSRSVLMLLAT